MTITMKRLSTALIALGMLGMGVASATSSPSNSIPYQEAFEGLSNGALVTNLAGWVSDPSLDLSVLTNMSYSYSATTPWTNVHTRVLQLNTQGATLTNNLVTTDASGTLAYLDTMVQFVPSDTPPAACTTYDSGIKLAVFANSSSNLNIYHGVIQDGSIHGQWVTNQIDSTSITLNTNQWYRLTVTYDATVYGNLRGDFPTFQVKIDGAIVTNANAYVAADKTAYAGDVAPTTTNAIGTWFRAATDLNNFTKKYLNAVAFQGTGYIDDLQVITSGDPLGVNTWSITQVIGLNGTADNTASPITINAGSSTTITYSASTYGYLIQALTTNGTSVGAAADQASYPVAMNNVQGNISNNVSFYRPNRTIAVSPSGNFTGATSIPNGAYATNLFTADLYYKVATAGGYDSIGTGGIGQDTIQLIAGPITNNLRSETVTQTRPTRTITLNPSDHATGATAIPNGAYATNTFTADANYLVDSITAPGTTVAGGGIGQGNVTLTQGPVLADATETVTFNRPSYTVTLNPSDHATGPTSVPRGASVTNVFTADQWFKVATIAGDGSVAGGGIGQDSVTLSAGPVLGNIGETVTFTRPTFLVTQVVGDNGSADPSTNSIAVLNGNSTSITYTASTWYDIDTLTTNGLTVAGAAGLTNFVLNLNEVQANISNNVAFVRPTYTVALSPADHATGETNIPNGAFATNVFTADTYWLVDTIAGAGSVTAGGIGQGNVEVTAQVTSNTSETVTFVRPTRHIVQSIGSNGDGSLGTGDILVPNGASTSVTYTAHDWFTATATAGAYGTPSGNGSSTATVTFSTVLGNTTAGATFGQKTNGAVVAYVPSQFAIDMGWTEAMALADPIALQTGYMLNLDPSTVDASMTVDAISVVDTTVNVTVLLDNMDVPVSDLTINGTLRIYATSDLAVAFVEVGSAAITGASFDADGKCLVTFTDADPTKFYQAEITLP